MPFHFIHLFPPAIFYLTYLEYIFHLFPTVYDRVHVNETSPDGLQVEFDVSLPKIPCSLLSIDASNPLGEAQSLHLDRMHQVWKHRLDANGREIGERSRFELGFSMRDEKQLRDLMTTRQQKFGEGLEEDEAVCGDCYGAGSDGECCNTCDDVKRAYIRRQWRIPDIETIRQCQKNSADISREEQKREEGCNIHGIIALSTGGGDFHIAPGHSMEFFGNEQHISFEQIILSLFETFNCSHTIHKLHFGQDFPTNVYQLDNQSRTVKEDYAMHQYYIQIVPTLYKFLNGTSIQTNQFSVTEHQRLVYPGTGRGLPGVFFFYEVSSLHVEMIEKRQGWVRFLTSVCAVVGGAFSVMMFADKFIYETSKILPGSTQGLG